MSESTSSLLGAAEESGGRDDDGPLEETFVHPAEGEQEKSLESEETLSDDEKSGG